MSLGLETRHQHVYLYKLALNLNQFSMHKSASYKPMELPKNIF